MTMTEEKMELMRIYNNRRYIASNSLLRLTEIYMKGEMPKDVYCELVADTALQMREDYEDMIAIMYDGMKELAPMWFGCWEH